MFYLTVVRERCSLRKADLARAALIHPGNYYSLENGKRQPCRPEAARILAVLRSNGYIGTADELFEEVRSDDALRPAHGRGSR